MIPILYGEGQEFFNTNGIGRLSDAIDCIVQEERNGIYELTLKYPVNGVHYNDIIIGRIIGATHDDKNDIQPFDIYKITKPLNGVITVNARHISYRLSQYTVTPFEATTCAQAFALLPANIIPTDCPFTFWTDKSVEANFSVNVPSTVRSILGGTDGSILDVYGKSEYEWDKWTVKCHLNRGVTSDVTIYYGKNLSELEHIEDESQVYSGVVPYWTSAETGETVMLDEKVVFMDGAGSRPAYIYVNGYQLGVNDGNLITEQGRRIKIVPLNLSERYEEEPTQEQLRNAAVSFLNRNTPWNAKKNIKINFVQLWQSEEYKNIAPLQRLGLCDRVDVYYPALGITEKNVQIVKVEYNVLLDRYNRMELGDPSTNLGTTIREATEASILTMVPTKSTLQKAIDAVTKLITGGLGGHVVIGTNGDGQPNEILIMDTDSIETAVNVLRINMNGIGFSTTGYNGPFRSAWTLDGHFVADFIDTGALNANLLRAGIISSIDGKNWWNLETGELNIIVSNIVMNDEQTALVDALSALDTKAGNAQTAAGTAQSTADSAVAAAALAQTTAAGAVTTADSASQTANAASQTAGDALAAAQAAETNAKALVVTLSRDSFVIPTDSDGNNGDYTGCQTVVSVQWGANDVTADADITIEDGSGVLRVNDNSLEVNGKLLRVYGGHITSRWDPDTYTYTVTESRADIAVVTFTVSYGGKTVTKQLNVIKALQGLRGEQGEAGQDGTSGVSVISVDVYYAVSTSSTIAPTTGWSTDQPMWEDGKYIWFKTMTAYSTGTTTESEPACITGSAGYPGETGVGIDSIEEEYYLSESDSEQTGGTWSTTATWENGKYLWQRLKITYDDEQATVKYTDPTLAQAINDANQRAEDAQEEVRNLDIGGVNLIRVSNTLLFDNYYFWANLIVNGTQLAVNGKKLWTRTAP